MLHKQAEHASLLMLVTSCIPYHYTPSEMSPEDQTVLPYRPRVVRASWFQKGVPGPRCCDMEPGIG